MSHTTMLALQGLSCMNCAQRVKKALESRSDVEQADVNVHYAKVTGEAPDSALIDSVIAAGYQAEVAPHADTELQLSGLSCMHCVAPLARRWKRCRACSPPTSRSTARKCTAMPIRRR